MTTIDELKVDLAQHIAGTTTYTPPGTWYLGLAGGAGAATNLANGDPSTNELADTHGYSRKAITFVENGVTGVPENNAAILFESSGGAWSEATHWFIAASGTRGTEDVKMWGPLNSARTLSDGDVIRYVAGSVKLANVS